MGIKICFISILLCCIHSIHSTSYSCDSSSSCGCSTSTTTVLARIIGGEAAANHAWGWMASLQRYNSHICGASLITPEYAITAAHCVYDNMNSLSTLSILVGTNYLSNPPTTAQRRTIIKAIINPNYETVSYTNDIAIIQFAALDTSSSSHIGFICLPTQNQDPFQMDSNLVAAGWGVTSVGSGTASNTLLQVTVQVYAFNSTICQNSDITDPSVELCAGVSIGGKDTCQGDSGGPLMAFYNNTWVLAGLTSTGKGCAEQGVVALYTRVSGLIPFIFANVQFSTATKTSTTASNFETASLKSDGQGIFKHGTILVVVFSLVMLLF